MYDKNWLKKIDKKIDKNSSMIGIGVSLSQIATLKYNCAMNKIY